MPAKVKKTAKKPAKKTTATKPEPRAPAKPQAPESSDVMEPRAVHPLQSLRQEIDTLFDNFLSGFPSQRFMRPRFDMDLWREPFLDPFKRFEDNFAALNKLTVRADMKETDKAIAITAELPGVAEDDIDVTVSEGRITIKAEKKEETVKDEEDMHLTERHYGSVQRTFTLPDTAEPDKAKAGFKDGVLTIDVPKRASAKAGTKKIPLTK